jgi:hypothetical protein
LPTPEPPKEGISRAKAHLLAEGSHWLATGEVFHDESEAMGRILAQMDEVVPHADHYQWLMNPRDDLDGYRPMDFIDAGQLEPLKNLLDGMGQRSGDGSGHGAA